MIVARPLRPVKALERGGVFSYCDFSWEGGVVVPSPKILRTYEKLPCIEEPYRCSGQRDHSVQTDRHTEILLLFISISIG